jgi:hypothetical protein
VRRRIWAFSSAGEDISERKDGKNLKKRKRGKVESGGNAKVGKGEKRKRGKVVF